MKGILTIIFLSSILHVSIFAETTPYYFETKANRGDGVYSLLRKYKLIDYYCNIQAFYELNALSKNDVLLAGKVYKMPVIIYQYNGISIRSTINDQDWEKAIRIKTYNENILAEGLRSKSFTESKVLWVPHHEMHCNQQSQTDEADTNELRKNSPSGIPANGNNTSNNEKNEEFKAGEKIVPLFGPEFERVKLFDESLKNKAFYIVSGHGGPDPGAMCTTCPSDLCEDEYAYDVALRLARNLTQHGAQVEMIIQDKNDGIRREEYLKCDKDETCYGQENIPVNQRRRLAQRCHKVNELSSMHKKQGITEQMVIIIHVDSRSEGTRQDVFFYHLEGSKKGAEIANNIQDTFKQKYDRFQKGRGYHGTVKPRGLYVLRNTNPPAVFIELANIRNQADQKRIIHDSNRQALANWIFEGITKD